MQAFVDELHTRPDDAPATVADLKVVLGLFYHFLDRQAGINKMNHDLAITAFNSGARG